MKIKRLYIENYKSLSNIDIQLNKDINLFIGKNNSGKSNIIDALIFLSRITNGREDIRDIFSSYGSYKEIVFGKESKEKITFNLEFDFSKKNKSSLFSELRLAPEILFDDFCRALDKSSYLLQLDENGIAFEEVLISYNKNNIVYARNRFVSEHGLWNYEIIRSFKEGVMKGDWGLVIRGGSSQPLSILVQLTSHSPQLPEGSLLLLIREFISSFRALAPIRQSSGSQPVLGAFQLDSSGANLPQVLNSIASSNRGLFEKIMSNVEKIIEEIEEIRSPIKEGTQSTYVSVVEKTFKDEEFSWNNIASGIKEALFLVTFLHTTYKGSLLMIEEPELHLHADAIRRLLSLINEICKEDDKLIIITTHSPILIDFLPFGKIFLVIKENGQTRIESLSEDKDLEEIFAQAGIPKSFLLLYKSPLFLLIVEGREDVKIWNKFLEREGLDTRKIRVVSAECGNKDIEIGKFIKKARLSIPFMIIRDSDGKKQEKEEELKKAGFEQSEYYVLSQKEIEDYLIDAEAIAHIFGKPVEDVKKKIEEVKGEGKEKLEKLVRLFGLSSPDEGIKELLASRVEIHEEILSIINKIKEKLH